MTRLFSNEPCPCHCEVAEGDRGNLTYFSMREIALLRLPTVRQARNDMLVNTLNDVL